MEAAGLKLGTWEFTGVSDIVPARTEFWYLVNSEFSYYIYSHGRTCSFKTKDLQLIIDFL